MENLYLGYWFPLKRTKLGSDSLCLVPPFYRNLFLIRQRLVIQLVFFSIYNSVVLTNKYRNTNHKTKTTTKKLCTTNEIYSLKFRLIEHFFSFLNLLFLFSLINCSIFSARYEWFPWSTKIMQCLANRKTCIRYVLCLSYFFFFFANNLLMVCFLLHVFLDGCLRMHFSFFLHRSTIFIVFYLMSVIQFDTWFFFGESFQMPFSSFSSLFLFFFWRM